jgi:hypothetical protein
MHFVDECPPEIIKVTEEAHGYRYPELANSDEYHYWLDYQVPKKTAVFGKREGYSFWASVRGWWMDRVVPIRKLLGGEFQS